jgi:hypothetical protein
MVPTLFANSKLVLGGIAVPNVLLLCSLLVLGVACEEYPAVAEPEGNGAAADEPNDTCFVTTPHEVTTGASCDARPSAPCTRYADRDETDVALSALLNDCFLTENIVRVEFQRGCATRFSLSSESDGSVECVADQLAAVRYDCLGDLSCGEGVASTLR